MTVVERMVLNAILGAFTNEQREAMAESVLVQSGRDKVDPDDRSYDPVREAEDDAINALRMGFLA